MSSRYFSKDSTVGRLMVVAGAILLVPLLLIPFYPGDLVYARAFLLPGIFSIVAGMLISRLTKNSKSPEERQKQLLYSGYTVVFAWLWSSFLGAMPFVLGDQLNFVQGLFEAISGWTTTGLSVMDVTVTPKIYLFYRSFMQYCGGLGFVMVMIMLRSNRESMNLYQAEGHSDQLMPNVKKTARTIFLMYFGFLVLGTVLYLPAGMGLFDAINHTMCALSTGGFSTLSDSIGAYHSLPIEWITIFLMIIGTTNFAVLLLLVRGKWKKVFQVSEVRFMFLFLAVTIPAATVSLILRGGMGLGESLRMSVFDITSALSTTGFSTVSYNAWPGGAVGVLLFAMLTGGGAGSTAGGIKLTRVYLAGRRVLEVVRKKLSSPREVHMNYYVKAQGKTAIEPEVMEDATAFIFCYLTVFLVGSFLLTLTADAPLTDAMFEFASSLGTVGLSVGVTGAHASNGTLIVEMFGMLLGRLELFIILTGLTEGVRQLFRRKSRIQ